jgi:hypothetical protein
MINTIPVWLQQPARHDSHYNSKCQLHDLLQHNWPSEDDSHRPRLEIHHDVERVANLLVNTAPPHSLHSNLLGLALLGIVRDASYIIHAVASSSI